ncbi:conserved hypothetical protein [Listeria monocytogenes]|nr:conserved hypothetical protein [Listeria monocytogenes QOC2]CDM17037.1 protein of unknown function [Listeria monocytogenes R479a]CDN70239.1 conserved hypothetical protein [Listeria monocytogenes 4423]CUK43851.1 conserved hypothetical protein [Listeria monocytogenes]CUK70244.1 conserved hypothetical protein [Listeria monocytogenes]
MGRPYAESNHELALRRGLLYPFNYMGLFTFERQTTEISLPEIRVFSKTKKHLATG